MEIFGANAGSGSPARLQENIPEEEAVGNNDLQERQVFFGHG